MRRIETGRKFTKQFIEQGLVPGVVVGAGKKPVPIVMKKGEIERQSKKLPFVNRPYYLVQACFNLHNIQDIDGEKELVRVRMITYQGANDKYHNVIFQRTPLIFGTKPYNKTEGTDLGLLLVVIITDHRRKRKRNAQSCLWYGRVESKRYQVQSQVTVLLVYKYIKFWKLFDCAALQIIWMTSTL